MKVKTDESFPIIEGTAEELVKLATAVVAAVNHQEAVMCQGGIPQIGIVLVESNETAAQ